MEAMGLRQRFDAMVARALPPSLVGFLLTAAVEPEGDCLVVTVNAFGLDKLRERGLLPSLTDHLRQELAVSEVRFVAGEAPSAAQEPPMPSPPPMVMTRTPEVAPPPPPRPAGPPPAAPGEGRKGTASRRSAADFGPVCPMVEVQVGMEVTVAGEVVRSERRSLKNGNEMVLFDLADGSDTLSCKWFPRKGQEYEFGVGTWWKVRGRLDMDRFSRGEVLLVERAASEPAPPPRADTAEAKRVELHLHSKMSALDGLVDLERLMETLSRWGHDTVAITDHGVVQAFPDAYSLGKRHGIRVLYGLEAYVYDDRQSPLRLPAGLSAGELPDLSAASFVVVDLETSGLSPLGSEILEVGAVRFTLSGAPGGHEEVEEFHALVRPRGPVSAEILNLTGITQEELERGEPLEAVLPRLRDFMGERIFVAHNASFDAGFLRSAMAAAGLSFDPRAILDTLGLARLLRPHLKNHRLDTLSREFALGTFTHHRALADTRQTHRLLLTMLREIASQGLTDPQRLVEAFLPGNLVRPHHLVLLVQSQAGLENLYRLVSASHLEHFYRVPRLPLGRVLAHREGLLIGSGCTDGMLLEAILSGEDPDRVQEVAALHDYLEIQPPAAMVHLVQNGSLRDKEDLQRLIRRVLETGSQAGRPVVATGDVHYLEPPHKDLRRMIQSGGGHSEHNLQADLHLRSTGEMLAEFSFLGEETANRLVVEEPHRLAEQVEPLKPVPDGLFAPLMPEAETEVRRIAEETALRRYGDPVPAVINARLQRELEAIIGNGFAVVYYIAHKLVKKSLDDGYLVGSRGSVGSSLVATMMGITEVNPLPPHYHCPRCHTVTFHSEAGSGFDLSDRSCDDCGIPLEKDGQDIPFETFMGFHGDKVPDIDLNFSGEYQATVHAYTEELFGKGSVFRAGTISTVAERTAFGFVKKHLEEQGLERRNSEVARLALGLVGVKRTTGQHPGGLMIVPQHLDVHRFTPVQHPADSPDADVVTTHFDYHSISSRLLKLDILGHDDPTVLRLLEDLTGIPARGVPLDDPATLSLFGSCEAIGVEPEAIGSEVGTFGIPEFGTRFVRNMLLETRPGTFAELVRISGLSHGTDVWANNAQELCRSGAASLSDVIATRDDIMVYLLHKGLEPADAFRIMEQVRKGKGLTAEDEAMMRERGVPEWYIGSANRISYMFPKAHAAAYVTMAVRIAWFKVHHAEAFYASYFTVRAGGEFDATLVPGAPHSFTTRLKELEALGPGASAKEKSLQTHLEVAREMMARGIRFQPVDLMESHATRFQILPAGILPPFASLPGLGAAAARQLVEARQDGPFRSVEELRTRARLARPILELLGSQGCLEGLPAQNIQQLNLF